MTVVDPLPPATLQSVPGDSRVADRLPGNVRLLDSRRPAASPPAMDPASRAGLLKLTGGALHPALRGRVHAPFFHRIRGWMVVPVVDFALILAPLAWRPLQLHPMLTMAVLGTLLLAGGGRYVAPLHLSVLDQLPTIVTRLATAAAAVSAVILLLHHRDQVLVFMETACQAAGLVIVGRLITTRLIGFARRNGFTEHHTVLIGGGPVAAELARTLHQHPDYGLKVDGFVDDGDDFPAAGYVSRLGRLGDLDIAVAATRADTLLVADGGFEEGLLIDVVRTKQCESAELLVVPRMHQFHTLTGMADHIGSIPVMRISNPNLHGPARLIKRLFDIVVAVVSLSILLPVLVTAAMAVRLEGGPGVIFRQVRVGRDGKHFQLLKFRTMKPANELESETLWCVASDDRVGPVGRLLRSTSIDELPQLWNILRGDMTLVGPRPERPHFVEQFSTNVDRYAYRHRVQVGLTGFAQVSGLRGDTSIVDRARFDNFYIENWSLWLDIKIILRTFREVILRRGC